MILISASFTSQTHRASHTTPPCLLAAFPYTRRSTRAASVLMVAFPGSAGGQRPPTLWSCLGPKPPSVCCLSRSLATARASASITTTAKPTRHGASTAVTRELYGARSVCGGSHTHLYKHTHTPLTILQPRAPQSPPETNHVSPPAPIVTLRLTPRRWKRGSGRAGLFRSSIRCTYVSSGGRGGRWNTRGGCCQQHNNCKNPA